MQLQLKCTEIKCGGGDVVRVALSKQWLNDVKADQNSFISPLFFPCTLLFAFAPSYLPYLPYLRPTIPFPNSLRGTKVSLDVRGTSNTPLPRFLRAFPQICWNFCQIYNPGYPSGILHQHKWNCWNWFFSKEFINQIPLPFVGTSNFLQTFRSAFGIFAFFINYFGIHLPTPWV